MIKDKLLQANAIMFGDFTLTSGKKSDYYVDMKSPIASSPELLNEVSDEIAKHVSARSVAGVELGAVPILVATAMKLRIPYAIIRKDNREHGITDPLVGAPLFGTTVDIIEDVVTTGTSVMRAASILRGKGLFVSKVICVVDREDGARELLNQNGMSLVSIVRISEILRR